MKEKPQLEPTDALDGEELTLLGSFYENSWPYALAETSAGWEVRLAPPNYVGEVIRTVIITAFFAGWAYLAWDKLLDMWLVRLIGGTAGFFGIVGPILFTVFRRRYLSVRDPQARYDKAAGRLDLHGGEKSFDREELVGVLLLAADSQADNDIRTEAQLVVKKEGGLQRHLIATSIFGLVSTIRHPFHEFSQATGIPLFEADRSFGKKEVVVRKLVACGD